MNVFMQKNKTCLWLSYLIYLYPLFLICGSLINNFSQIVIYLFTIYLIIKKKIIIPEDQKNIFFILIFLFVYSFFITYLNGNYFFLKNTLIFLKIILLTTLINYLIFMKIFELKKFVNISAVILIIVILDTFFQFIYGKNLIGYEIEPNNLVRLTSFFKDEYVVGGFIARIYLPILIFITFSIKNQNHKFWFFLLFSIIINVSIFITGERSSVVITFINFCMLFVFIEDLRKEIIYKFLISILVIFTIFLISDKLKDRYIKNTLQDTFKFFTKHEENINKQTIYDSHYGAIYLASLEIAKESILFGQGMRSYRINSCDEKIKEKIKLKIKNKTNHSQFICSTHPHNYFLELILDLGLFGFTIFMILIYLIFKRLIIFKKKDITKLEKFLIISFAIHFLSIFWPLSTHGSIFSSWNSTFFIFNISLFLAFSCNNIKLTFEK